ncbi:MAG: DUF29 domain-containing protein [Oscillatoria sp. PMC 1068.18]|nr:DUF29 domain-containing protein [Oscillatoria sp. PMC 1076.18]MEC4990996.1 DUF29 domain-containing protein [Oscillatoria sp. PMC 1068.18]
MNPSYLTTTNQTNLYDRDFYLWTETTTNLLRENQFHQVDLDNLIEEIASMGKREKRELKSRLIVLLMHLLKWKYQSEKRSPSWNSTISEQRICLELLLEDSPSLKSFLAEVLSNCYQKARSAAARETNLSLDTFPEESPFSESEIFDPNYLPEWL